MDLRFDAADVRLALAEEEPDKDGNACESARGIKTANLTVAHYLFSCDGEALVGTRYTFGRITRNDFFSFLLLRFLSLLIIRLVLGCNVLYCTMLFGHASRNRASPYRREVACNKGLNSRLPVSKPPVQLVSRGVVGELVLSAPRVRSESARPSKKKLELANLVIVLRCIRQFVSSALVETAC